MSLDSLGLAEAAGRIRSGVLSPVELLEALLARIEVCEPSIRAWVTLDGDGARAEARALEAEARTGRLRGPLHGIPIGIKDIFRTRGMRTTAGSPLLRDFVPDRDAAAVRLLRQAGAVILGKTVTTEFAFFDPGPTRNPWNTGHTPGGSSSGSAAAVAARMIPAAVGSQTAGSIGRPAAFCGVVGFVPGQARIPLAGVFPLAWTLDHAGLFARSVRDAALVFRAVSGAGGGAPPAARPPRIGLVRDYFHEAASEESWRVTSAAATAFQRAGAVVEEARMPPLFRAARACLMTIFRAEAAAVHHDLHEKDPAALSPKLRALVECGRLIGSADYLRARRIRRRYIDELHGLSASFDVFMSPAAPGPAPEGLESTGDPTCNIPWTLGDLPTLVIPCALTSAGMPLGVQLASFAGSEERLLEWGRWCEEIIAFRAAPPEPPG